MINIEKIGTIWMIVFDILCVVFTIKLLEYEDLSTAATVVILAVLWAAAIGFTYPVIKYWFDKLSGKG